MTEKEITIHGVDVGKCEVYQNRHIFQQCWLDCGQPEFENCYFKQTQRKTAECEKYKQALGQILEIAKSFNSEGLCFYDDIDDCANCDMKTDCNYLRKIEIINIITKVKEGNNEHEN